MTNVTYYFDPACPYTWYTTKWLRAVEGSQQLNIDWRSFSLLVLNGPDATGHNLELLKASHTALRVVEALRKDGKQAEIAQFYSWMGERHHDEKVKMTMDFVAQAVEANELNGYASALKDESLDTVVEESTSAAITAAGPDVGSPVITFDGIERGFHGPVLTQHSLSQDTAERIWTVVETAVRLPEFCEIKRGRG